MLRGGCAIIKKCGLKIGWHNIMRFTEQGSSNEFTRTSRHKRHGQGGSEPISRGARYKGSAWATPEYHRCRIDGTSTGRSIRLAGRQAWRYPMIWWVSAQYPTGP